MKVALALAVLSFLGLAYAAGTKTLYDKCNNKDECSKNLDCQEIWSDCTGQKQCVCNDDKKNVNQVYVLSEGKCKDKVRLGGTCSNDKECAYDNGKCIATKCDCKKDKKCRNDKKNTEACTKDEDCSYFDKGVWKYATGKCKDKKCECPDNMDMDGEKCKRQSGPKTKNQGCNLKNPYTKSTECKDGLFCRKCYKDGVSKCRSGQGMIHASVFLVMVMLGISLLKM